MTKEQTLIKLAASRQALHQAIKGLSVEDMTQVQVEGVWTVKDVVGHITAWEEVFLKPLRRYADGGPFETDVIEDYMTWNDEQAARKRDVPLDGTWTKRMSSARSWSRRPTGCRRSSGSRSCRSRGVGRGRWRRR